MGAACFSEAIVRFLKSTKWHPISILVT
jgi:hypothetical protein